MTESRVGGKRKCKQNIEVEKQNMIPTITNTFHTKKHCTETNKQTNNERTKSHSHVNNESMAWEYTRVCLCEYYINLMVEWREFVSNVYTVQTYVFKRNVLIWNMG